MQVVDKHVKLSSEMKLSVDIKMDELSKLKRYLKIQY